MPEERAGAAPRDTHTHRHTLHHYIYIYHHHHPLHHDHDQARPMDLGRIMSRLDGRRKTYKTTEEVSNV